MSRYAEQTSVSSEKSRIEIEKILDRYGCSSFVYGKKIMEGILIAAIEFEISTRLVRMTLPLPNPNSTDFTETPTGKKRDYNAAKKSYEQAIRQSWRALLLVIKAKLEAIESGISTFDQEFLAHLVLPNKQTIGDFIIPQIDEVYKNCILPVNIPGLPYISGKGGE